MKLSQVPQITHNFAEVATGDEHFKKLEVLFIK
jgi:hypothetical protein